MNQITSDRQELGRKSSSNWMTLYRTAPGYTEDTGGAFDIRYSRHEVQFMPTLVLRENIPPRPERPEYRHGGPVKRNRIDRSKAS